jgi:hypothetical protein
MLKLKRETQEILLMLILVIISFYITKYKEISYLILFILVSFIIIIFYNKSFTGRYIEKTAILAVSLLVVIYGINYNNYYLNNYIIGILMFINIFILLKTCFPFKTIYDYISLIGIILLLIKFDFSKWKVKNMKLVNIDYNWIYLKTFVLTIMYIFSSCPHNGYNFKLLFPLYAPFLFPLNEYIIHRCIYVSLGLLHAFF